jgi:PRTRC genetic system protein C
MALSVINTPRVFEFKVGDKDLSIDDPNPNFSPDEVVSFLANTYPSITNSDLTGPVIKNGKAIYKVNSIVGTKG